jgi:hypothetical protein
MPSTSLPPFTSAAQDATSENTGSNEYSAVRLAIKLFIIVCFLFSRLTA